MEQRMSAEQFVIIGERRIRERRVCDRRAYDRRAHDRRQRIQDNTWTNIVNIVGFNTRKAERRIGERRQSERRVNRCAPERTVAVVPSDATALNKLPQLPASY